ncbi:carboxylesterase/lipase family protein [Spirillospora sp. CA-294931]|uniref:carboxylesterase/lipase family protein n=1 Tax=Spirillospora sp. CA-294931 TaxID=3240042 RepID=UPI003D8EC724
MSSQRTRAGVAAAVVGLTLAAGLPAAHAAADPALVMTASGPVRGTVADDHRSFQGIPYAAPPQGDLRWRSPRPAAPWTRTRDATRPGDRCAQSGLAKVTEDCLNLNVTTPRGAGRRGLPVMVWIHGGGYQFGGGDQTDPRAMAARGDVVVVTLNYRLGVFGFLGHPALGGASGNFALEDQQAALRWVRRNAAAFGGDPGNVTIFGESSGARSVCAQLVAPGAAGLFHRAIVQSEPCTQTVWPGADGSPDPAPPGFPRPRAVAYRQGQQIAAKAGCPDPATAASCLRDQKPEVLLEKLGLDYAWPGPVFGGGVLPEDPAVAIPAGRFAKVPVMHGITRDEYRIATGFTPIDDASYPGLVEKFVGAGKAPAVLARYPLGKDAPANLVWPAVVTDAVYARPAIDTGRAFARHVPTYAFEFADRDAPWMSGMPKPAFSTGAYHTSELQYLFKTESYDQPLNAGQRRLSEQMMGYWTRFARTGDPNGHGSPWWPRARGGVDRAQSLAPDDIRQVDFAREHNVRFWRSITG